MEIAAVMTKNVLSLSPDNTILDASIRMTEKKISGAPVINDEGKLLGMLSEADVLRSLKTKTKTLHMIYPSLSTIGVAFREQISEKEAIEAYKEIENTKVSDIMTSRVLSIGPEEEIRHAIDKMVKNGINRLPVIDQEGKLVGIITRGDILRGIAEESKNNSSK